MKVAYVHNSARIGGGNKVLLGLFERLDARRFEPISILPGHGPMEDELRSRGIRHYVTPMDKAFQSTRLVDGLLCTASMASVFLREAPAIMHANGVGSYRYASRATCVRPMTRVCQIHHPGEALNAFDWALKIRPDAAITGSAAMERELAGYFNTVANPPPLVKIFNTIETQRFTPMADRRAFLQANGLDRFSHILVIVGSVNEHKGHRLFLDAAVRVLCKYPAAGFLVIGEDVKNDGAYRRQMETYAREIGIGESVIFYGFASEELVPKLVAASDLFVLPTREEGFGLALAEAQACGVAVVSTTYGPIPEVVADGDTGLLVPVNDLTALTAAVMTLLDDPARRKEMGVRGRERAARLFGPERYAREVEAVYDQVLASRERPSSHVA